MKHATRTSALKSLLLGSAAIAVIGLSPAMSQDRSQIPSGPNPSATQSKGAEPDARENRSKSSSGEEKSQRGAKGEGSSPSAVQPGDKTPRATQNRDDDRKPAKGNQAQERDTPSQKDNQAKDRDSKRDRNQANERDGKRDRDQAQDRDGKRDRDQARDRDGKRDQARDSDRRDGRTGERQVTEQQRTRITTSIRQANVQPLRNVNFSVSVGAVVPSSVRFHPVTPAIVEVYPQYRGYQFVLVEEEIVVVEPRTRKIVTVIDSGGSGRAASRTRGKLSLTEKQREVVRRAAIQRHTTGSARTTTIEREYVVGDDLPDSVEFEIFPDTIYSEVPEIRSYRYVVREDDVYVIDPTERRVIEIIR